ncbi:MAG: tol-pal system protein YbgF, partial [bacterium]|nr:tol-pal system protein YbgF [bacterium]
FQRGLDYVQRAEYQQGITAFQQFLKLYPKSPQKDEAQFWIAECRYGTKDFTQAIKDYQKFVELYPKSSHAPQAVLKQGDSFLNLQMKDEAKVFYKKLAQDYPRSQEAAQARGKLAALENTGIAPTAPSPTPTTREPREPADF